MIQDNYFILNCNGVNDKKKVFFFNVFNFFFKVHYLYYSEGFQHNTNNFQGDLIISVTQLIEALTIVTDYSKKPDIIEIVDTRT